MSNQQIAYQAVTESIIEWGVCTNLLDGRKTCIDAYMACLDFIAMESLLLQFKDKFTTEEWEEDIRNFLHFSYLSPNHGIIARMIHRVVLGREKIDDMFKFYKVKYGD